MVKSNQLTEIAKDVYETAKNHGWYDKSRTFGDVIALCHCELSEALDFYRKNGEIQLVEEDNKPDGIAVELIDCMIRILDYLGSQGVDVDDIINRKMLYNESRPYRHGNKLL